MSDDPHEILGVPADADVETVRRAYRKLAAEHHPDRSDDSETVEKFKRINEAYDEIVHPDRRRRRGVSPGRTSDEADRRRTEDFLRRFREMANDPVEQRRREEFERQFERLLGRSWGVDLGTWGVVVLLSKVVAIGVAAFYAWMWFSDVPYPFTGQSETLTIVIPNLMVVGLTTIGATMIVVPDLVSDLHEMIGPGEMNTGLLVFLGWLFLAVLPPMLHEIHQQLIVQP